MADLLAAVTALIAALKGGNSTSALVALLKLGAQLIPLLLSVLTPIPQAAVTPEVKSALTELNGCLDDGVFPQHETGDLVGSQLTVFWHNTIAPFLKKLLESILGKVN
jgi:hypothetical protein